MSAADPNYGANVDRGARHAHSEGAAGDSSAAAKASSAAAAGAGQQSAEATVGVRHRDAENTGAAAAAAADDDDFSESVDYAQVPTRDGLLASQFRAMLIKTAHYQRRQVCDSFCVFVMPFVFLLIAFIIVKLAESLNSVIEPTPAERKPLGGFPAYPFDANACEIGGNDALCDVAPFAPAFASPPPPLPPSLPSLPIVFPYSAPDPASASSAQPLGRVAYGICNPLVNNASACRALAAAGPNVSTGVFGSWTLMPFGFRPYGAEPTNYNNDLLRMFGNNKTNVRYRALVQANSSSPPYIDNVYGTVVAPVGSGADGWRALKSLLYDSFYKSARLALAQFYGAYAVFDTATFPNVSAAVYYNNTRLDLPYQTNEASQVSNAFCFPDGNCQLIAGVTRLYDVIYKALGGGGGSGSVDNTLRVMPRVAGPQESFDFISIVVAVLIGLQLHFILPSLLRFLVFERESGIRQIMRMMGLRLPTYYVGTYIGFLAMYMVVMLMTIVFGLAFRIPFFVLNTPLLYFVLFFLWGNALISFAMFLAPFIPDTTSAVVLGWMTVIVVNFIGGRYLGQMFTYDAPDALFLAAFLLPSFAFLYCVYYAGGVNVSDEGLTVRSDTTTLPGQDLGMCSGGSLICVAFGYLIAQWLIFLLLGLYFDQVLPHRFSARRHPLFFLGYKRRTNATADELSAAESDYCNAPPPQQQQPVDAAPSPEAPRAHPTLDVGTCSAEWGGLLAERQRAAGAARGRDNEYGVCIDGLVKAYAGWPPFVAVRGLSLAVPRGECFALLGSNGAGKSTAMHCLTGVLEISSGRVQINGMEVPGDLPDIHLQLGVCPQFDLQWDDLTGEEHLYFYARIKNVPRRKLKAAVDDALRSVKLDAKAVRRRRAGRYSGGMRRRLSVAMALIGGSSVIVLDEPSTGLDPQSRYDLWACIQKRKAGRTVLLTTHSMEEAERLADRAGIMALGKMRALGMPEELKMRSGRGYRLTVSSPAPDALHEYVLRELSSDAVRDTALDGHLVYNLPRDGVQLSRVFHCMEAAKAMRVAVCAGRRDGDGDGTASVGGEDRSVAALQRVRLVDDWSISQSTLEDVFIRVTQRAEREEARRADGRADMAPRGAPAKGAWEGRGGKRFENGARGGASE